MSDDWTNQEQAEALRALLARVANNKITERTHDRLYDGTYPLLVAAGKAVMTKGSVTHSAAILALGLAAWNRGNAQKKRYGRVAPSLQNWAANGAGLRQFDRLREAIAGLGNRGRVPNDNGRILTVLWRAHQILFGPVRRVGLAGRRVAETSKLLHFLAPYHFPIIDSNVSAVLSKHKVITRNAATGRTYVQYTRALWALGFFGNRVTNNTNGLARYRKRGVQAEPTVSHLRVVDCTLFKLNGKL